MSLVPPGTALFYDINLYASAQVAVTCAVLYDHALAIGREVELIWMKPLSLVTVLYVIERYLGDVVLIVSLCLCFSESMSEQEYVDVFKIIALDIFNILSRPDVRAWGALAYSWATQATMQLRIYAMYSRSRRILILLLSLFFCEIAAISFIIWREIGPHSPLEAVSTFIPGEHFCTFSGIKRNFMYIFIPFLCFEFCLFLLALPMLVKSTKRNKVIYDETGHRVSSFAGILVRDSLCYFFVNLVACAVVMGLWQGVTELYANICVPFVMLLEVLVGTRLILGFRERYAQPDVDPAISGRSSSLHFRGDEIQMDPLRISVQCQIETIVFTDPGT